jgi:hypothetical protein
MSTNITPKAANKVTIRTIRVRGIVPSMSKAARKLAEKEAVQVVERAVNAWFYSQG